VTKLAKLRWRCRRGCLELDLLLTRYLEQHYPAANAQQKRQFEELIALDDSVILANKGKYLDPITSQFL
jgi:antitoxin CptB